MRFRLITLALALAISGGVSGQTPRITTVAGNGARGYGGDGGRATSARLNWPAGVAIDSTGDLYIGEWGNHRVRKVSNGVITTVAGNGIQLKLGGLI